MLNPTGPSPEAESRLTFGVELEFLLATLPEGGETPHPSDSRKVDAKILADEDSINHDIQRKLEEVGILATVKESEFGNDNEVAANIATNWILKTDCTVDPGLHVHVGNGYHGFEWPILRNFMAIAWTYERQILLLMPEIRLKNVFCKPLDWSPLVGGKIELTRLQFLNCILALTDNEQVCVALGTRNAGFNISNLAPPFRSTFGKRTIEFRQHPGTLDSEGILHWVHICVKLVEKACHVKDEELFERLRADVERPIGFGDENSVTTVDYLMWLGCPAQAYYYGKKLISDKVRVEKRTKGAAEKTAMGGGHVVEFI